MKNTDLLFSFRPNIFCFRLGDTYRKFCVCHRISEVEWMFWIFKQCTFGLSRTHKACNYHCWIFSAFKGKKESAYECHEMVSLCCQNLFPLWYPLDFIFFSLKLFRLFQKMTFKKAKIVNCPTSSSFFMIFLAYTY